MSSHRLKLILVWVGLIGVGPWGWCAVVEAQTMSATLSPPPQRMPAYGAPATYPSTDPSTYPSTSPSYPSTYPSTSAAAAGEPSLATYQAALPGITAPTANGVGDFSPSPLPSYAPALQPHSGSDSGLRYAPYGSPDAGTAFGPVESSAYPEQSLTSDENWNWQILPSGLMYKSYLAGNLEPRISSELVSERGHGWLWDATIGGRVGLLRYGTDNDLWPQGWQWDVEAAAFPRLDLENQEHIIECDYRAGTILTTRQGPWEAKFGFYHLCSHIGDEYLLQYPTFPRINYVRESLLFGMAAYVNPSLRLYGEAGWCFQEEGGAQPWEFQFGADFSSPEPTGIAGAPFFAINAHLRQENDFGGNLTVETGWQWRGRSGHLLRAGVEYFNGMSDEGQFYKTFEEYIGFGLWYDF